MSVERGHNTSQNATQPRSHVDDGVNEDEDEDQKMLNRFSIDSTASTLLGDSEEGDDGAPWTEDQLAILNRTLEEGQPPGSSRQVAPRTPYILSHVPENLLEKWARQIKHTELWPHSVKATRRMLRNLAKIVASERRGGAALSDSEQDGTNDLMDYEHSSHDILEDRPPPRYKDRGGLERAALRLKATDQILNLGPVGFHPYAYSRLRSPLKSPRSPSVEATSPVESYFPTSPIVDSRRRSRSTSPSRDGRHSPTKALLDAPSLSPMKLSPRKKSADDFDESTMFLASLSGVGAKLSGSGSSIPSAFYTPDMQRSRSHFQPLQGSKETLASTDDGVTTSSAASSSQAQTSSVSSAPSRFAADFLPAASGLLASPTLLPAKLFGRKRGVRPKDRGGKTASDTSDRERTSSPSPPPTLSPVSESNMMIGNNTGLKASPDARMQLDETPRPRVMSTPRMPRKASAELRTTRQSPLEPRRDGEPRRKRVKTDELATPPRELRSSFTSPQNGPGRALSTPPRSLSKTPPRRLRVSGTLKTPPRRSLRSPRLLPGGGRTTPSADKPTRSARSISPLPLPTTTLMAGSPTYLTDRLRSRSPNAPNTILSTIVTPESDNVRTRSSSMLINRRTVSPSIDDASSTIRPNRTSLRSAMKVPDGTVSRSIKGSVTVGRAVGKTIPKREPSFFGEELGVKSQSTYHPKPTYVVTGADESTVRSKTVRRVGTTKFPATSTTSISSVLFPGGREDVRALTRQELQPLSNMDAQAAVGTVGSGEESIIRAGEHAALARKPQDVRSSVRASTGIGFGRSKMTRSVSMLGPGERPRPY
ncbi:hypothetical protein FRC20_008190 [Serendipita sp. 405]|nr:hypothetical protein FRC20_008190 [Serendipita sp. 405]